MGNSFLSDEKRADNDIPLAWAVKLGVGIE
jgi:hypothetical protein